MDVDDQLNLGRFLVRSNKENQDRNANSNTSSKEGGKHRDNNDSMYNFDKNIIRIEYPGLVKNIDKAIETLGGISVLAKVASGLKQNLELHFHPNNRFNKSCCGEKDTSPGILICVRTSRDKSSNETKIEYEVIGLSSMNFKFNRLCDFQYLPLASADADETEDEYVHEKVFPQKLPELTWLLSDEIRNQTKFWCPSTFSRFDTPHNKLYLNAGERFNLNMNNIRPDIMRLLETNKSGKKSKLRSKNLSKFVNLMDPNAQIPSEPVEIAVQIMEEKDLKELYGKVKELFDERPVWSKSGVQYMIGLNQEQAKSILPTVAYFCSTGPWRMAWIKFDYNPLKDYNSRIYQTLDYRIRTSEGMKVKVDAKRKYSNKILNNPGKVSSSRVDSSSRQEGLERSFILRPHYIPPARQMFYQYCDILLPEIQEMLERLPKIPANMKFDPKNGWLPSNFTEQCREIVNKYVVDRVRKEILEENVKLQQQRNVKHEETETTDDDQEQLKPTTYCSKMLSNIKKGIYKSVNVLQFDEEPRSQTDEPPMIIDTVNLTDDTNDGFDDDDDDNDELDLNYVVNSIPETMDENSDDEGSDVEIDMEVVEEINELIAGTKQGFENN